MGRGHEAERVLVGVIMAAGKRGGGGQAVVVTHNTYGAHGKRTCAM